MPTIHRRTFLKTVGVLGAGGMIVRASSARSGPSAGAAGPERRQTSQRPLALCNNFPAAATEAGAALAAGSDALDAVEQGIRAVESDPATISVGLGGMPNWDGVVELDAAIMHGPTRACGAVAALQGIEHPVSVARKVMEETPHVFLVGQGAQDFALGQGFETTELLTDERRDQWRRWRAWEEQRRDFTALQDSLEAAVARDPGRAAAAVQRRLSASGDSTQAAVLMFWGLSRGASASIAAELSTADNARLGRAFLSMERDWVSLERREDLVRNFARELDDQTPRGHDTIGLIVMAANGDLCCGLSTSDAALKLPGRVGDSPLIGAGGFVDNEVGAAIATGTGEQVIRFAGTCSIVENMRRGMGPHEACTDVLQRMRRHIDGVDVLFTALDRDGNYAHVGTKEGDAHLFVAGGVKPVPAVVIDA